MTCRTPVRRLLLSLAALLLCAERSRAAVVAWSGAGDGTSFQDAANWYPPLAPGPADQASISSSTVISVPSSYPLDLISLTLGDGISSPTLKLSTGVAYVGTLVVKASATLEFDTAFVSRFGDVTVEQGGLLMHAGPVETSTVAVRIEAARFELQAGATVTVTGKGLAGGGAFTAGAGPGGGHGGDMTTGAGGGGHGGSGGPGGNYFSVIGAGGPANDVPWSPILMGSGGGGAVAPCFGGPGGGFFELVATTAVIDGLIVADGVTGANVCSVTGGGGAGGTILIRAENLYGAGRLKAHGAPGAGKPGSIGGGGGSGGRISVRVTGVNAGDPTLTVDYGAGGFGSALGSPGTAGTTYVDPKAFTGLGGANCSDPQNWSSRMAPQPYENVLFASTSVVGGCNWNLVLPNASLGSMTLAPTFPGVVNWTSIISSMTGNFTIAGGTLTMSGPTEIRLGGDWVHTGGKFELSQGTVVFAGSGAQSIAQTSGGFFYHVEVQGGSGSVSPGSDLDIRGSLTPGARWTEAGGVTVTLRGTMNSPLSKGTPATTWVLAGASAQGVSSGPFCSMIVQNPAGVTFPAAGAVVGPGLLRLASGGRLDITNRRLALKGSFVDDGGTFVTTGSTLAFTGSGYQTVSAPAVALTHVDVQKPAGTLVWLTSAVVSGNVTLRSSSTLELVEGATLSVRGHWTQTEVSRLDGSTGTVVFDGTQLQMVYSSGESAFHHFIASNTASVRLSSGMAVSYRLELARGTLDFSTQTVRIQGDFLRRGGLQPGVSGSTVVFDGGGPQLLDLGAGLPQLDSLVVGNTGAGLRLGCDLLLRRNFTVLPGATFDGSTRTLTMAGAGGLLSAVGANYLSPGGGSHVVRLDGTLPAAGAAVSVASGSVVHARLEVARTGRLLGDLRIAGAGNSLDVREGAWLDGRGSTVTLADGCDASFSTGSAYVHDADSWLVFEGTSGTRGASLSTGPFGGVRLAADVSTSTFLFGTMTLDGHLVLEAGSLLNAGNATLSVRGSLLNEGGTLAFGSQSTGTLRMGGPSEQSLKARPGDWASQLEVAGSSSVLLAAPLAVGGLRLASGTLRGGTALLDVKGDWTGQGGRFLAEGSTVSFSSAAAGAGQSYSDPWSSPFNGLSVGVSTMVFLSTFSANVLTSTRPGTTLLFSPASGGESRVRDLRIAGALPSSRARLVSSVQGTPFRLNVVDVSSVTAAEVRDSSASGRVIHANDSTSLDLGGNFGWNFFPNLLLLVPPEGFSPGVGRTGSPAVQIAGTTFTVTVLGVSESMYVVPTAPMTVSLRTSDPFDAEPSTKTLSAGSATFDVCLRTAEPYPATALLTAFSTQTFTSAVSSVRVDPSAFDRLQVLVPSEIPVPGSPSGRSGIVAPQIAGEPFYATVRAVDKNFNLISGAADTVALTTASSLSSATFPSPLALIAGATSFEGVFVYSTGAFVLAAKDLTNLSIAQGAASPVSVFQTSDSSPTVALQLPNGAKVSSIGGILAGTASDGIAVSEVRVAVRHNGTLLYRDWGAGEFSAASPLFRRAAIEPINGHWVDWELELEDAALAGGREYYVIVVATNPSNYFTVIEATFSFDASALVFGSGGGEGTAALAPATTGACRPVISTLTFTVGSSGLGPGGALAVRLPAGWTPPGAREAGPTPSLGGVVVTSTSTAWPGSAQVVLNPPSLGSAVLGDGWIAVVVSTSVPDRFRPGEQIRLVSQSFPAGGPGERTFEVRASSGLGVPLLGISTQPAMTLTAGPPKGLRFSDYSPLALGPLQPSPTLQLLLTDECGAAVPAVTQVQAALSAAIPAGSGTTADPQAQFFLAGGGATVSARIAAGASASEAFYYRTSLAGSDVELVRATAVVSGVPVLAERLVALKVSSVSLSGVAVGTAPLPSGTTSATLVPGQAGARAVIGFRLADPAVGWEVVIATDAAFSSPVFRRTGLGDPALPVEAVFEGLDCAGLECRFVPSGTYRVRVRAGGSAENTALEVRVAATASIYGSLGDSGAGAKVRAEGPGAGPGNTAVASSTGYFQLFGLQAGQAYAVTAATRAVAFGRPVALSTSAKAAASMEGASAGPLAFTQPAALRVSAMIPMAVPQELWGSILARDPADLRRAQGVLHFPSNVANSDDGAQALGRTASTWTVLGLEPGVYGVEIDIPGVGISTRISAVTLVAGASVDLPLRLGRKAALYGYVIAPATAPFGAGVSVEALREGETLPAAVSGAFIPPPSGGVTPASASYRLYGLTPGSWTIRASAPGFASTSSVLLVAGESDIGDPATAQGGLDLRLGLGAVLAGTVTVRAPAALLPEPRVFLEAYEPATGRLARTPVALSTGAASSTGTFRLGGLEPGTYRIGVSLKGFEADPPGPREVVVAGTGALLDIELAPDSARLALTVRVPRPVSPCRCAADFNRVGLILSGPGLAPRVVPDVTSLDGREGCVFSYHESSMTFLSPPLGNGFHEFRLLHGQSGQTASVTASLVNGTTASAVADLSGTTHTVSGVVTLSGSVHLRKGAFSVTVSSMPGLLAQAATTGYCLLSSSMAVSLSAARVELVPWDASGSGGTLMPAATSCAAYALGAVSRSLIVYAAGIGADGHYAIAGVPPGAYELRVPADVDGDPAGVADMAPVSRRVTVAGATTADVELRGGSRVAGRVRMPAAPVVDRPLLISLADKDGRTAASTVETSGGRALVPFTLERVADGSYRLSVSDLGLSPAFAARSISVEVGGDVDGLEPALQGAGTIKGKLVVERPAAGGGVETLAITPSNSSLLPRGLSITAVAVPWVQGGRLPAAAVPCVGADCPAFSLDADGRFTVPAVLEGTYDLETAIPDAGESAASGSLDVLPGALSGIQVVAGQATDVGVVRLRSGRTLLGRVVDEAGQGLANVPVEARPCVTGPGELARLAPVRTRTDAEGRYALAGLDPAVRYYDVTAAGPQPEEPVPFEPKTVRMTDIVTTASLDFTLAGAQFSVSGRAVSDTGAPLLAPGERGLEPGALVYAQREGLLPSQDPAGDTVLRTGADGSFSLAGLSAGAYRLTVAAADHESAVRIVTLSTASAALGLLQLTSGAVLEGAIRSSDGSAPGDDELELVVASRGREILLGRLTTDPMTRTVTGYRVSGLRAGEGYRLSILTKSGELSLPEEASSVVLVSSAQSRRVDLVFRRARPFVLSKSRRTDAGFVLDFRTSQPLRSRRASDADLSLILSTVSAQGVLGPATLSADRMGLSATYVPAVGESSFTVRVRGYSAYRDPDATDLVEPEFLIESTAAFYTGLDGVHRTRVPNAKGASLALEGETGRLSLPQGAFLVDGSSWVEVSLQSSGDLLRGAAALRAVGAGAQEANLRSLRFHAGAYPADLLRAMTAAPPEVVPRSAFYDVSISPGVRTTLAKPVQLSLPYAAEADPSRLNVYWYNPAANAYVLQQDAEGAVPVIDRFKRTLTLSVGHFSTFVLLDAGAAVISGSAFARGEIEAFNFPNPFDLEGKTVTPIHGAAPQAVRGTMIRISVPPDAGGDGTVRIFNAAGERVRTLDLGRLVGGRYYYQPWDGRNDSGRDVASGVYVAQVKVGGRTAFFKLAVIK